MGEQTKRENVGRALLGALLGALTGAAVIALFGAMGRLLAFSGILMGVLVAEGFRRNGGRMDREGMLVCEGILVVMAYLGQRLGAAFIVARAMKIDVPEAFAHLDAWMEGGGLSPALYWVNLVGTLLLGLLALVLTARRAGMERQTGQALEGRSAALEAYTGGPIELYPAAQKWIRPLYISYLIIFLASTLMMVFMLVLTLTREGYSYTYLLGAFGSITAVVGCIVLAIPAAELFHAGRWLYARKDEKLWRIDLELLNTAERYRFSAKGGAFLPLRWERLTPQERAYCKDSVSRIIADREALAQSTYSGWMRDGDGDATADGIALPLTGLEIRQQNRWSWRGTYRCADGRRCKIVIAKAYPGLIPVHGWAAPQRAMHPRPGVVVGGLALTLALTYFGASIGYGFDHMDEVRGSNTRSVSTTNPYYTYDYDYGTQGSGDVYQDTQEEVITEGNYRDLFQVAHDYGYRFTARGYIKTPAGMFGEDEAFTDVYLPYSEQVTYSEDGCSVQSTAHGMSVSNTIAVSEGNAETVVEEAYAALLDTGVEIFESGTSETYYEEGWDIAYKRVFYFEDDLTKARIAILYAECKRPGYYLSSQITYLPEQMDERYPVLVEELSDAFALSLPVYEAME